MTLFLLVYPITVEEKYTIFSLRGQPLSDNVFIRNQWILSTISLKYNRNMMQRSTPLEQTRQKSDITVLKNNIDYKKCILAFLIKKTWIFKYLFLPDWSWTFVWSPAKMWPCIVPEHILCGRAVKIGQKGHLNIPAKKNKYSNVYFCIICPWHCPN